MMNPYVLMALGVAWLLSMAASEHFGYTRAENAAKARQADAVTQAIVEYDEVAEQDKALAIKSAQAEARSRTIANTIRTKANEAITAKPLPVSCDWNTDSFGLLIASVNGANDNKGASDKLPDAVRRANAPGK